MKSMVTPDGRLFGFLLTEKDEGMRWVDDHGLTMDGSITDILDRLSEKPRLDRTPEYILVIPRSERDMLYLKMIWG